MAAQPSGAHFSVKFANGDFRRVIRNGHILTSGEQSQPTASRRRVPRYADSPVSAAAAAFRRAASVAAATAIAGRRSASQSSQDHQGSTSEAISARAGQDGTLNATEMLRLAGLEGETIAYALRELADVYPPPPLGWHLPGVAASDECARRLVEGGLSPESDFERHPSLGGWRVARRFPEGCRDLLVSDALTELERLEADLAVVTRYGDLQLNGARRDLELETVLHQFMPTDLAKSLRWPAGLDGSASGLLEALGSRDNPEFDPQFDPEFDPQFDPEHGAEQDVSPAQQDEEAETSQQQQPDRASEQDYDGKDLPVVQPWEVEEAAQSPKHGWPVQVLRLGSGSAIGSASGSGGPVVLVRREDSPPSGLWGDVPGALRVALLSDTTTSVSRHIGVEGETGTTLSRAAESLSHAAASRSQAAGRRPNVSPEKQPPALFTGRADFQSAMAAAQAEPAVSALTASLARTVLSWRAGQLGIAPKVRGAIVLLVNPVAQMGETEEQVQPDESAPGGDQLEADPALDAKDVWHGGSDTAKNEFILTKTLEQTQALRRHMLLGGRRVGTAASAAVDERASKVAWAVNETDLPVSELAAITAHIYTITDAAIGAPVESAMSQVNAVSILLGSASSAADVAELRLEAALASKSGSPAARLETAAIAQQAEGSVATACRLVAESVRNVMRLHGETGICHNDLHTANRFLAAALHSAEPDQATRNAGEPVLPAHTFSTSYFTPETDPAVLDVLSVPGLAVVPGSTAEHQLVRHIRGWPPQASAALPNGTQFPRFGVYGRRLSRAEQQLLVSGVLHTPMMATAAHSARESIAVKAARLRMKVQGDKPGLVEALDSAFLSAVHRTPQLTDSSETSPAEASYHSQALAQPTPQTRDASPRKLVIHPILLDFDGSMLCSTTSSTADGVLQRGRVRMDPSGSDPDMQDLLGQTPAWSRDTELLSFVSSAASEMQQALSQFSALPYVAAGAAETSPDFAKCVNDEACGTHIPHERAFGHGAVEEEPSLDPSSGAVDGGPVVPRRVLADADPTRGDAVSVMQPADQGDLQLQRAADSAVAARINATLAEPNKTISVSFSVSTSTKRPLTPDEAWDEAGLDEARYGHNEVPLSQGAHTPSSTSAPAGIVAALGPSATEFAGMHGALTPLSFAPDDTLSLAVACAEAGMAPADADRLASDPATLWLARLERKVAKLALKAARDAAGAVYASDAESLRRKRAKRGGQRGTLAPHPASLTKASLTREQLQQARRELLRAIPNGIAVHAALLTDRLPTGQSVHGAWGVTQWVPCGTEGLPAGSRCLDMTELHRHRGDTAPSLPGNQPSVHSRAAFFYGGQMPQSLAALSQGSVEDAWAFGAADLVALLRSLHLARVAP